MARARKRRRPPTLNDGGVGLLEAILPHETSDDPISTLPAGQRDPGGFWFPAGYAQPGDIFTPAQRKLQAKQRQVQRRRLGGDQVPSPVDSGSARVALYGSATDRPLPLPSPSPEALDPGRPSVEIPAPCRNGPATRAASTALAGPARVRVLAADAVVDSGRASD
jgi:hypothetical protein